MKLKALLVGAILALPSLATGESLYVSQTGTGDGASCNSARSVAWFNTSTSWANPKQAGRIGAGDTVFLCGTITSDLVLQNNGASGSPIVIDGSSATLGTSANFATNNRSWWHIRNVKWVDGATDALFEISGGANGVVENARADGFLGGAVFLRQYGTVRPNAITIRNNYFRTTNTDIGNVQLDIIYTEGSTNVIIEGNHLEMRAGGAGDQAHDDCIQTWQKGGTNGGPPQDWTIRYNWIVMNSAASADRSWTMLENLGGTVNIYGNVFLGVSGASGANGLNANTGQTGVVYNVFNNTFVAKGTASNNVLNMRGSGTANVRNNIFHLQSQTAIANPGAIVMNRSNNLWFGSRIPSCTGITGELCGQDPQFIDYANNNFGLKDSSPARSTAADLGAGPTGQTYNVALLASSTWPNPVEASQAALWDRGALVTSGGVQVAAPQAPTNVRVTP